MRSFLIAFAISVAMALGISAPALAITFGGTVNPSSIVDTGPVCDEEIAYGGTGICFSDHASLDFDLSAIGEKTLPLDLFKVNITDEPNSWDDKKSASIKVQFEFSLPSYADGTITGDVTGYYERKPWSLDTYNGGISIVWDAPIVLDFGGSLLQVQLLSLDIECEGDCVSYVRTTTWYRHGDRWYCGDDWKDGHDEKKLVLDYGYVQGIFTLLDAPSSTPEVPLPETMPLLATGFLGFAYMGFRRRRKS